jgi:hypothetical protein
MLYYIYLYAKIGLKIGAAVFIGNIISVCVPNNRRVDKKYEYTARQLEKTWDREQDCIIIALTKGLISGALWPSLVIKSLRDLIYDRKNFGNFMQLGYNKSPYYLNR